MAGPEMQMYASSLPLTISWKEKGKKITKIFVGVWVQIFLLPYLINEIVREDIDMAWGRG